jgi:PKHD-type hydroxylase
MQYMLTPYAQAQEPFAWWEGAFNEQQLNWLQQQARNWQQKAAVGGGGVGVTDPNIRRSGLHWLPNNNETQWVFETLGHVVSSLNAQFFGFDLLGFGEQIQLTNYDGSEQGMYGWHVDMGPHTTSPCRKLSIVVQLSDPVDYEGGVLELQPSGKDVVKMRKQRGLVVAFPSWTLHQVTPVTQGNRQSLVAWISGPPFK